MNTSNNEAFNAEKLKRQKLKNNLCTIADSCLVLGIKKININVDKDKELRLSLDSFLKPFDTKGGISYRKETRYSVMSIAGVEIFY